MKTSKVRLKGFENSPVAVGDLHGATPVGTWKFYYPKSQKIWQTGRYNDQGLKTGIWKVFDDWSALK